MNRPAALPTIPQPPVDQQGRTIDERSEHGPQLVVFLRHGGCTFCRQVLADLQAQRSRIEAQGLGIVLVHMDRGERAADLFTRYGMQDVARIADPEQRLYAAFELRRGRWWQLLSPLVWWKGFVACIVRGHGMGRLRGDVRQLPGSFIVHRRRILRAHRPDTPADRPDFCQLQDPT